MATRPVSPAELFELQPEAWQKLLHVEADTANRICGGRQRRSSCEPAAGWRIRKMAGRRADTGARLRTSPPSQVVRRHSVRAFFEGLLSPSFRLQRHSPHIIGGAPTSPSGHASGGTLNWPGCAGRIEDMRRQFAAGGRKQARGCALGASFPEWWSSEKVPQAIESNRAGDRRSHAGGKGRNVRELIFREGHRRFRRTDGLAERFELLASVAHTAGFEVLARRRGTITILLSFEIKNRPCWLRAAASVLG